MRLTIRGAFVSGAALLLAGCAGGSERASGPRPVSGGRPVADYPVKIGQPYQVGGVTYAPADTPNYDEVGYASWYGDDHEGRPTANGEGFRADGISAAHKTLPLPSYVEVTALDTGRTILVRVNDRGPFVRDRIIDLSSGAAQQLGMKRSGVAAVRVRRVNPPEQERAVLRAGHQAAARLETPSALLSVLRNRLANPPQPYAPPVGKIAAVPATGVTYAAVAALPETKPMRPAQPAAAKGAYVVQVGAFSNKARADSLAAQLGAWVSEAKGLWRVRLGPYGSEAAARQGVEKAAAKGYSGGRIMANDSP